MKKLTKVFVIASVGLITSCSSGNITEIDEESVGNEGVSEVKKELTLTASQKSMVASRNGLGVTFVNYLVGEKSKSENVVVSPLSINFALGMLANGADGNTRKEILDAMKLPVSDIAGLNDFNSKLLDELPGLDSKVVLKLANSMWFNTDFKVLDSFIKLNTEHYKASSRSLNLFSPECLPVLNGWINSNTEGLIPKLFDSAPSMSCMLVNALYFNGQWKYKFKKSTSATTKFSNADGTIRYGAFMNVFGRFEYASNDNFECVALPYSTGTYRMLVVLPKSEASLTGADLDALKSGFRERNVMIEMPKFEVSFSDNLKKACMAAGINLAFTNAADFSKMTDVKNVQIDVVQHVAALNVNESGTEAAAATVVGMTTSTGEESAEDGKFIVDRPFFFVIEETSSETIIFIGKINKI